MSRRMPTVNVAMPAMDVARISHKFRCLLSSRSNASNLQPMAAPTNADVFSLFRNDILAARRLGLGWKEIADELARAGVHKRSGALFTGSDIRIYSRRKIRELADYSGEFHGSRSINLSNIPDDFINLNGAHKAIKRAETLLSTLPNVYGAQENAALRILIRIDAVSSSRMDGLRTSLEDLLDVEARGVSNESLGRRRQLLCVRRYVDALEYFVPIIRQAGGEGLTPALIQQLQNAVAVPRSAELSEVRISDVEPISRARGAMEELASVPRDYSLEQVSHCAQGNVPPVSIPDLFRIAIVHAQHDALLRSRKEEGRAGRLLLTLMLAAYGINYMLVSNFIEARKTDYISALRSAQQNREWEPLVCFLSEAIISAAREVRLVTQSLEDLSNLWKSKIAFRKGSAAQRALDILPYLPLLSVPLLAKFLGVTATAARRAADQLVERRVIECRRQSRNRVFSVPEALIIINERLA